MDISGMIQQLKNHPDASRIGMIASHLGIVRGTSRNGREVRGVEVKYDHNILSKILNEIRRKEGIVDVVADVNEGYLTIGEEILFVAVAGDIREHVFTALMEAVNRIKSEASRKKEHFA
ncbi:MAG: molybdenum cofactor biosynthesis protein MoaE [Deltaproteobacteria bacterium]|nr:molybdenum cofactor biosynthesis protein MoaE [Deltaproteobacteria bacterium]MBW2015384.1 molybdenum cofactor biosynthesis protein MoaE [Deltaproteobacteria bacterium]MBW2128012.1 molybdenum cofactor biosynthesis protein MoaE [Deltaproteobacteria bacterium]MBW2302591.1 molybdenum cofactor biosynthesis protein MoaE [Deltaproteobacteria bacterium]